MLSTSSILVLTAAAALASAQTTTLSAAVSAATDSTGLTGGTSGCGTSVDAIITSCLLTTQAQLTACPASDWACMCEAVGNVLTCYNNCPSDPRRVAVSSQQTSWCGAAKAANPSLSASASMSASASASAVLQSVSASVAAAGSATTSSDAADSSETSDVVESTGAAGQLGVSIAGAFAAVFGVAAAVF